MASLRIRLLGDLQLDRGGQALALPASKRTRALLGYLVATGKPQTLRLEIHAWPSAKHKHHCVFVCVSPQPETAAVWKTLREIRAGCTCR